VAKSRTYSPSARNIAVILQQYCSNISIMYNITKIATILLYYWINYRHVHLQLCLISYKLNKIFNIQILLQMQSLFIHALNFCRYISWLLKYANIIMTMWTYRNIIVSLEIIYDFLFIALFLALNYICQTVYYKV